VVCTALGVSNKPNNIFLSMPELVAGRDRVVVMISADDPFGIYEKQEIMLVFKVFFLMILLL
jgi:hypothetical protein